MIINATHRPAARPARHRGSDHKVPGDGRSARCAGRGVASRTVVTDPGGARDHRGLRIRWQRVRFCAEVHSAVARHLLGDGAELVDQVRADGDRAPVGPKLQALLAIAEKVRRDGRTVTVEDVARARAAGADDKAIHDTVLIAAAFCMFNRYVDGLRRGRRPSRRCTWTRAEPWPSAVISATSDHRLGTGAGAARCRTLNRRTPADGGRPRPGRACGRSPRRSRGRRRGDRTPAAAAASGPGRRWRPRSPRRGAAAAPAPAATTASALANWSAPCGRINCGDADGERAEGGAAAAVVHDHIDVRQQVRLRHPGPHGDVGRHVAKLLGRTRPAATTTSASQPRQPRRSPW